MLVVYTHWVGVLGNQDVIKNVIFQNEALINFPVTKWLKPINNLCSYILPSNLGVNFGLGLFFLISGYIIPFSTKNQKPHEYLIRRFFRIYPTLIACITLTSILIILARWHTGEFKAPFNLKTYLYNIALLRDMTEYVYIETAV